MRPVYQGNKNIPSAHLCSRSYTVLKVTLTFARSFISVSLLSIFLLIFLTDQGKTCSCFNTELFPTISSVLHRNLSWLLEMWFLTLFLCISALSSHPQLKTVTVFPGSPNFPLSIEGLSMVLFFHHSLPRFCCHSLLLSSITLK